MPREYSSYGGSSNHHPYSSGGSRGGSGVYTSSGAPVRNVAAYTAAVTANGGGRSCYTASGAPISSPVAYSGAVQNRTNSDTPKHLYHYTDSSSLAKIETSGYIKASQGPGDCSLGKGVYMTAKVPETSSKSLLENNYNGSSKTTKVEGYVRVDANKVQATSGRDTLGRNVFVVKGDVDLKTSGAKTGIRK